MLGLGAGFYLPSGIATITARYAEKHWGKVIGIHELAPNLGTLTAPFIVAIVAGYLPYRYIFLACAILVFAAAFIFNRSETGRADIYGTPPVFKHCNRLLRMRAFWMMVILFSLGITAALGLYNMLPLFLVSEHNMSSVEANSLIAISRVATLFTAIAGGWLADRAGACATMGAALLLSGIASAGIGVSDGSSIRIFVMLQPVMAVAFFPAAFKMMSGIRAEGGGDLVVALVVPMAYMIGGGLTPAVMGHAADLGFFRQCFIICGIMITSGVIPVIFLWKAEAGKKRYMRAP
jgi:NNP family nitrate/nitrite transporter-like MFS transporter